MLLREFIMASVSVFLFDKEQSIATNEARKDNYLNLFNGFREHAAASNGDKANGCNLLGVELARRGLKKEAIYTKRSEFLRIWDNIQHVPEDCASWKKALTAIREATTPASLILLDKMLLAYDAMIAAQEKMAELYSEWQELSNIATVAETVPFSDEVAVTDASRQLRAA